MKIVFLNDVIYQYASKDPSAVGGAERSQWLLSRALARTGWSVTVGVREALEAGKRTVIQGVEFTGIGGGQILSAWYRFLSSERPDWWYWRCASHWWGPAVGLAKLARVRTIFSAGLDSDVRPRHSLFRHPRWWPLYAWGLSQTDKIFVQHGGQLTDLSPRWRSKATILPSIVDKTPVVRSHSERERYVAWVGVLRKVKRPDLLVEIARKAPDIRFVVCGGPSNFMSPPGYGEWIVNTLRAQPNIEFLGQVPPQTALEVIAHAAMLLSTSDVEGFPNVFLEAWSGGTPVVSLKIDPDRIIEREALGTVPGTVESAVAEIEALMDSELRRHEIAVRACRYVAEHHSEPAVTAAFNRAVQERRS